MASAAAELATGIAYDRTRDKDETAYIIGCYVIPITAALASGGDVNQFGINKGISDSQLQNN